jgi:hypothetical protein
MPWLEYFYWDRNEPKRNAATRFCSRGHSNKPLALVQDGFWFVHNFSIALLNFAELRKDATPLETQAGVLATTLRY